MFLGASFRTAFYMTALEAREGCVPPTEVGGFHSKPLFIGLSGGGGARLETSQCLGFVVKVWDALEETGNGERLADTAVGTQEFEATTLTVEIHKRGCDRTDARTVYLRHISEIQQEMVSAVPHEFVQCGVQPVVVVADGGSADQVDDGYRARFSGGDFKAHDCSRV